MKNVTSLFILFLLSLNSLLSQTAKRDTGLINGAAYEILIPANWNKKLVLYAHGYDSPNSPPNFQYPLGIAPVFLERGFAVARSNYKHRGWALTEGVDDTEALRTYFVKKYGKVDSTFITGHSMGGGVTVATIEKSPKIYNGGLALCPLSSPPYVQVKGAFDGYVLFNALFSNPLPKAADVMSGKAPAVFTGDFRENMGIAYALLAKIPNKELLAKFANYRSVKIEDLPFILMFTDGVLRDLAAQAKGNPFDNTNTLYSGFPDDFGLNKKIERVAATVSNDILTTYDRTGIVNKPLLMMHTTYDQLIPPQYGIDNYDNLVQEKHKQHNLKVFYTNGQGHCAFSNEQTAIAFDDLRAWAKSGQKPATRAFENPAPPVQPDTLCYELRVYTAEKGKLNDLMKRFRNNTLKIFEKNGMTNIGYWTPLDNPDEKIYYVLSYPNRAARDASWKSFSADTTWKRVAKESEANGKLVAKVESIFLKTTDFSPNNWKSSNGGVWEFRIYTATPNNLDILLGRFRNFTVKRFEQYGMTNKAYWTATDAAQGSDKMLYYFLTHPSPKAGQAAFDAFRNDPEWMETRKASEVKGGGSLTVKVESIYMTPTDFSPIK